MWPQDWCVQYTVLMDSFRKSRTFRRLKTLFGSSNKRVRKRNGSAEHGKDRMLEALEVRKDL